ncbi:MAG: HAMP domain-containing sensor histidine kinase [Phycisphaeraceae bacterium]
MAKRVQVSLANKCQLLFGAAVVLILTAALSVVWHRMQTLVTEGQAERAREIAEAWLDKLILLPHALPTGGDQRPGDEVVPGLRLTLIETDQLEAAAGDDPFLAAAVERFGKGSKRREHFRTVQDEHGQQFYRYARAIRRSDLSQIHGRDPGAADPAVDTPPTDNPLQMVLLVRLRADLAKRQLMLNRIYIVAAGLFAGVLAIGVFWFITTRIILSPVRVLRDYAEKVSEGDLNIRADINTGDEFEQLSVMFNTMLDKIRDHADQLSKTNKSLDLKLGQLAETNIALYEANKIKGEFLANVSHELRTPLNSMIGFAEVLAETLADRTGPVDEKRKRYIANIISSSHRLLDLINELLDLAKIEAGRMELRIGPMSISDTAEGLINLIRPQAEKHHIELDLKVEPKMPIVQTDAGKVQQIVFNFLSNAVKFTPDGGTITLAASRVEPDADESTDPAEQQPPVRFSVSDTGPGIALEDHERIFDKFTQLDPSVTKEHLGTGLGLTISRDLAKLLQGRIELDSDRGRGATFSLIIPLALEEQGIPLMPDVVG